MDYITQFTNYLQYEKRLSSHTVISYTTDLEQFFKYAKKAFEVEKIKQFDAVIVRTWVITLMETGVSSRSINRKISALKSFFNYHLRVGNIEKSPMFQVTSPKMAKRLPEYVAQEDMERLFSSQLFEDNFEGWRDRAVIELFYSTGMRLSELINIKKHDVDFYENSIKVLGKRNKERIIPFTPTAKEVLEKYFSFFSQDSVFSNKNCFIFVTTKGKKLYPKAVYNIVRKYLDMITTIDKRSPHVIRHTFATHLLNNGADINAIKEILGHANLAATQIYTRNSIEKLKSIHKQSHPRA